MMTGRGASGLTARLLCAAAFVVAYPASAAAQADPADPGALDPSAPLDPLPELELPWPDLDEDPAPLPSETETPVEQSKKQVEVTGERRYANMIEGLDDLVDGEEIRTAFESTSTLAEGDGKPANAAQIGRRSEADAELLAELLRSYGFYDATVQPSVRGDADNVEVTLKAEPGVQYRFTSVTLPGLEGAGAEDAAELRAAYDIKDGDAVIAQNVIDANAELARKLGELGFATAKMGDQDIVINHETRQAQLTQPVTPGPVAVFGKITVSGLPPFDAKHVGVIARFRPGDQFRRSRVDDLRRALIATGLIANADVIGVPRDGGRVVDVTVNLEPAPQRTIAGELGYGTGQGARAEVSWTNRNFFNPEGALTLRGVLGTNEQLAGVQLRRNNFRRRDQVLNAQFLVSNQEFDAYKARTVELSGNVERQSNFIWQKKWTYTLGAQFLATDEQGVFTPLDIKTTRTFLIAAVPGTLGYDGSDNLLDPTTGFRLSGFVSPEISFHGGQQMYARTQFDASAYRPVSDKVVIAGRVRVGTILGAKLFDVAPSRRFYSGGGGSVRGYGYQRLGPRDVDNDPIGGRGLAEASVEARIRLPYFGGNLGVVPFVDVGNLSEELTPGSGTWRLAAGVGLRYYSAFGPIRIDLGVPLNREKGDGIVAVAVSLGQAF